MRTSFAKSSIPALLAGATVLLASPYAHAVNPLEYPDNGSAAFSRGGAWLALANEPIAAHYNPAALAIQGNGFSIEQQLNFDRVCYERVGPGGKVEGPEPSGSIQYIPACNTRRSFPSTIPAISVALRVSRTVGIGLAIVPPATYGRTEGSFPALAPAFNKARYDCLAKGRSPAQCGSVAQIYAPAPAPYRYQGLDELTTIIFPTVGIGWEMFRNFRLGAAFISGIATINSGTGGVMTEAASTTSDHAGDDTISRLTTKDLFVPGLILSAHWSATRHLDIAAWGRYISPIQANSGELTLRTLAFSSSPGTNGQIPYSYLSPICYRANCPSGVAPETTYHNVFRHFKYPYPPEVRVGFRFHLPREDAPKSNPGLIAGVADKPKTDPLHDEIFDIELDGSYTLNEKANTIEVRFADKNGKGAQDVQGGGYVPPNADRWNGYINSYGIRLGGQVNVVRDKFAIRAGTWFESRSEEPEWLQIGVVGGARGGYGGGFVLRQGFIDISFGYQYHWSQQLDNEGHGAMRAPTGALQGGEFDLHNEPPGVSAANRSQFRTAATHTVNDGRMSQAAHAFTLGGTIRF